MIFKNNFRLLAYESSYDLCGIDYTTLYEKIREGSSWKKVDFQGLNGRSDPISAEKRLEKIKCSLCDR